MYFRKNKECQFCKISIFISGNKFCKREVNYEEESDEAEDSAYVLINPSTSSQLDNVSNYDISGFYMVKYKQ